MQAVLDFRNTNALWGSVLVETLVRRGVRMAVISPGSRSTPLAMACAAHPGIEAVSIVDERSAAFFALGQARRTHVPVAVICTSGTAGANHLPAVIEAYESNVPLIVITADRPPEMRDCSSGQTVDQQKLFGGFAAFFHELAVADAKMETLRYLRQTVSHACTRALMPHPGPVHLNLPLRDPLPPIPDGSVDALKAVIGDDFFAHLESGRQFSRLTATQLPTTGRGLIVAGPANPPDADGYVTAVRELAEGLGWPVLADALSPIRHASSFNVPVVCTYDAVLRRRTLARDLVPRYVICLEGWPTSRVLREWLEQCQAEIVLVADTHRNRDSVHGRTRMLPVPVEGLKPRPRRENAATNPSDYATAWGAANRAALAHLAGMFEQMGSLFEPKASWLLARHLPEATPVFVASSMPVRDVECFWPAGDRRFRFSFNRGANGIDGTLSPALGVAHGGPPSVALVGDLALLHDANGLLAARRFRGSLTIVLINNNGGGIFEHLPVSAFDPPFEELFATPQHMDFGKLCAAYGVEHVEVGDWVQFAELVSKLPDEGVRVLEIKTDRKRDAADRRKVLNEAGQAAEG